MRSRVNGLRSSDSLFLWERVGVRVREASLCRTRHLTPEGRGSKQSLLLPEWRGSYTALLLALVLMAPIVRADEPAKSSAASAPVTVEQVRGIVADMRGDPAFANRHTEKRLRWIDDAALKPPPGKTPGWLRNLARWLAEGGRGLAWVLGAVAVAVFLVFAWRWARVTAGDAMARAALRPSHVNDLDIRPESLPDDIASAGRALLQRGEPRAALSLLYRGALSKLVHDHGVAIRAASTEGECLGLAQRVLAPEGGAYFERLVRAWQSEVYAGRSAEAASIEALCTQFDAHFKAHSAAHARDGSALPPAQAAA